MIAALFLLLIGAISAPAATTTCPLDVRVYAETDPNPAADGLVVTSDDSLLVSVRKGAGSADSRWSISPSLMGGRHQSGAVDNDPDRVDVESAFESAVVTSGRTTCTINFYNLGLDANGLNKIAVTVPGRPWKPVNVGDVRLTDQIHLTHSLLGYDGSHAHLSGIAVLSKTLPSNRYVEFTLDRDGYTLVDTPHRRPEDAPMQFQIPADQPDLRGPTLDIDRLQVSFDGQRSHFSARLPLYGNTIDGKPDVPLTVARDGHFQATWKPGATVAWLTKHVEDAATIRTLDVYPAGKLDSKGDKRRLVVSGSASIAHVGLLLSGAGLGDDGKGHVRPAATFSFEADSIPKPSGFKITNSFGYFKPDGSVILSLDGQLAAELDRVVVAGKLPATGPEPLEVELQNVRATVEPGELEEPERWQYDFSAARVVSDNGPFAQVIDGNMFGHRVGSCPNASDSSGQIAEDLCVGIHLQNADRGGEDDIAQAHIRFCAHGLEADQSKDGCHHAAPGFLIRDVNITLPKTAKTKLRLGIAQLSLSQLNMNFAQQSEDAFHGVIADSILRTFHCSSFDVTGSATFDSLNVPGAIPQSIVGANGDPVPTTPLVGVGANCTAVSVSGWIPIQLSPQSSLIMTSFAFVHGRGVKKNLTYLSGGGIVTSGNITVVFKELGFRTLSDDSKETDHCDRRQTKIGETCLILVPDYGLTAAINGVRNADAIGKAITGAAAFVAGALLKH